MWRRLFTKKKKVIHVTQPEAGTGASAYYRLVVGSTTWGFIKQWANDELSKARLGNDSLGLDEVATSALRGRIDVLKDLLDLPEEDEKRGLLTRPETGIDGFGGSEYGE